MFKSEIEQEVIDNVITSAIYSASVASFFAIFSSFLMQASLNYLWGMINTHQLMIYLPLLENLKYPANAAFINE